MAATPLRQTSSATSINEVVAMLKEISAKVDLLREEKTSEKIGLVALPAISPRRASFPKTTRNKARLEILDAIRNYVCARYTENRKPYVFITKDELRNYVRDSLGNSYLIFFEDKNFYAGLRKQMIREGLEPMTLPGSWGIGTFLHSKKALVSGGKR